MVNAVHRVIERQVAERADQPAIVNERGLITYRELNARANALARGLIGCRFQRGAHAVVEIDRSPELAITLLGILKAGGAYSWTESAQAPRLSVEGLAPIALTPLLSRAVVAASPNLPILTRGSDIACVLPDEAGSLSVAIPHESIVSMQRPTATAAAWLYEASAFDLWASLMAGTTLSIPLTLQTAA